MEKAIVRGLLVAVGALVSAPTVLASTAWQGTANYLAAPGAAGDEAIVGPFDTYDFGAGIGLIKPSGAIANGTAFSGYFQTVVNSHLLAGTGINVPQLNVGGSGSGFELTFVSQFSGTYGNVTATSVDFNISSGSAKLYFDTTPDYNFATDSGFTNDTAILTGAISGGLGTLLLPGVVGVGAQQLDLNFTGIFGGFDANVYQPATIGGGSALFSISTKTLTNPNTPIINQVASGANTVMGVSATGGMLAELDGKLSLTAVPLPAAAWFFFSGMMGLLSLGKRKIVKA